MADIENGNLTELRGFLLKQAIQLEGLEQRVKFLEGVLTNHREMNDTLVRLDERMRGLEQKMEQWKNIIWGILILLLAQLVAVAIEYLKRGAT